MSSTYLCVELKVQFASSYQSRMSIRRRRIMGGDKQSHYHAHKPKGARQIAGILGKSAANLRLRTIPKSQDGGDAKSGAQLCWTRQKSRTHNLLRAEKPPIGPCGTIGGGG
jgi:hypothetical protein